MCLPHSFLGWIRCRVPLATTQETFLAPRFGIHDTVSRRQLGQSRKLVYVPELIQESFQLEVNVCLGNEEVPVFEIVNLD